MVNNIYTDNRHRRRWRKRREKIHCFSSSDRCSRKRFLIIYFNFYNFRDIMHKYLQNPTRSLNHQLFFLSGKASADPIEIFGEVNC